MELTESRESAWNSRTKNKLQSKPLEHQEKLGDRKNLGWTELTNQMARIDTSVAESQKIG